VKIKHSKFKNTGLIFELLVKQITSDTLSQKDSPAIHILKQFYTGNSNLVREFKLYSFLSKHKGVEPSKAEQVVNTIEELTKKLDYTGLKKQKYELIKELKNHYSLDDFFATKVEQYKPFAALHCLVESKIKPDAFDPGVYMDNRTTLLEHLVEKQNLDLEKDPSVKLYEDSEKDIKILAYQILLEKFNKKYTNLLPVQKNLLKEYILSVDSTSKLRTYVNEELQKIKEQLPKFYDSVQDGILKIKLEEVCRNIKPLQVTEKVGDTNLVKLLQMYELINELSTGEKNRN